MLLCLELGRLAADVTCVGQKAGAIFQQPRQALLASGSNAAYSDSATSCPEALCGFLGLPRA